MNARIQEILSEIQSHQFGWDGEEGLPVREDALRWFRSFWATSALEESMGLHDEFQRITGKLHADGTFTVRFTKNNRHLDFRVLCHNSCRCVQRFDDSETVAVSYVPLDRPKQFARDVFCWIKDKQFFERKPWEKGGRD